MPGDVSELIGRDKHVVCRGLDEIDYENIGIVSGVPIPKAELLNMKCLIATEHVIVLRVIKMKGFVDPVHQHDDHDTVSTLVSGRLMNHIGGASFTSEVGSTWRHRPRAPHWSEALEDSVVVEIKTPPVKTW